MVGLVIISIVWIFFYALHSLLALPNVKNFGEKMFRSTKNYRLFYSTISVISLGIAMYYLIILPNSYLLDSNKQLKVVSFISATYGLIIIKRSFRFFSISSFLGFSKETTSELIISGLHKYVRHPIYSGTVLIYMGAFFFQPTDLMAASLFWLITYLPIGIYLEEKKLIIEYGERYLNYRKNVKALIPKVI